MMISCSDDNNDAAVQQPPAIRITSVASSTGSLTFQLDPQHAERCAWLVLAEGADAEPDAAYVLEHGTAADASLVDTYTASELEPETRYAVLAAAGSSVGTAFDRLTMTTAAAAPAPTVEIGILETTSTTVRFSLSPSGADRCWYAVTASGESRPDADALQREGIEADATRTQPYTVGELSPGTEYFVSAVTSADGLFGPVVSEGFTTEAEKPTLPGLTDDVIGKEFIYVERSNYFGDLWGKNTGWFVYMLSDREPDQEGAFAAGTAHLAFELHADLAASEGGVLPADTYTVRTDLLPGTCLPGKIINGFDEGSYVPDVTYYNCNGQWGIVDGGSVTVETTDDGYRLAFDFTTEDGHRVSGTYAGTLLAQGSTTIDPDATTTLTGDYEIQFASGDATAVEAYYYGYVPEYSADLWSVYMEPVRKDANAEGFMMDLLVDPSPGYAGGFPAGTPDAPDEYNVSYYGEPGHYLPGEYDEQGTMVHTWYLGGYIKGPGDEWMVTRYAATKMGFIYIAREGDRYTITLEYSDEYWHTVTGSWSGAIVTHDVSAAAAASRPVGPRR